MTLRDLLADLSPHRGSRAIYVARPWAPESAAVVVDELEDGSVPDAARGMTYLTTVSEARRALEERRVRRPDESIDDLCEAVIYYARYDACEPLPSQRSGSYAAFGA